MPRNERGAGGGRGDKAVQNDTRGKEHGRGEGVSKPEENERCLEV